MKYSIPNPKQIENHPCHNAKKYWLLDIKVEDENRPQEAVGWEQDVKCTGDESDDGEAGDSSLLKGRSKG